MGQVGLMVCIENIFIVEFVCVLEDKEPQFDSICSILFFFFFSFAPFLRALLHFGISETLQCALN